MLKVLKPFVGFGYNMPAPGTLIDPPEPQRSEILGMGLADAYETKIMPVPDEVKKKPTPSASSRPAQAPRRKTRKKSKRSAKKS